LDFEVNETHTGELYADGTTVFGMQAIGSRALHFKTNNTERLIIDSGGSVLIGKSTPTDLHNTWNHLIIGEKGAIISENGAGGIDGISISDNAYIDADTGAYAYQTTAAASIIRQTAGITEFANAASGSAGAALTFSETMRIDASGRVTMPSQPAFSVRPSSSQNNLPINGNRTVIFGTEVFDQGGNFASNTFTAPVTGRYQFNAAIYCLTVDSATEYVQLALRTSNRLYYYIFSTNTLSQDAFYMSFPLSVLADMDAGDTATLEFQLPNSGTAQMDVNPVSYFSGYLVA
jgi:hypothetical protein